MHPWTYVYDATTPRDSCYQFGSIPGAEASLGNNLTFSDDCLYLNVWTNYLNQSTENPNLPVMVWIYGGAFETGLCFNLEKVLALLKDYLITTIAFEQGYYLFQLTGS